MAKLIPIHIHTEYSLLDGMIRVGDLVKYAVENELPAIAITDHGVMYSAIEFYEKAKDLGVAVKSYPAEKDDTDLQLLLENLPSGNVICTGVWGGRFDHLYSNVFSLLAHKEKNQGQVILADDKEAMLLMNAGEAVKICLQEKVKALSLLPLCEESKVTLKNVRWELEEANLKLLHPYAISNIPDKEFTCECIAGKIGLYLCFVE